MNSWSNSKRVLIKVAVLIPNYMVSGHLLFSLLAEKFVKKFSTIFQFQKLKSVQICNFLGENFQNLHFLGWIFSKLALFGWKFCPLIFPLPHPNIYFPKILTYVNICNILGFYSSTWHFYLSFNLIFAHLFESPVMGALSRPFKIKFSVC